MSGYKKLAATFFVLTMMAVLCIIVLTYGRTDYAYGTYESITSRTATPNDSVVMNSTETAESANNRSLNRLVSKSYEFKSWRTGSIARIKPHIDANCALLWNNTESEVSRVQKAVKDWTNAVSDKQFMTKMTNCSLVLEEFTGNFYVSQEEIDFPLAFSLVVHTAPQQVIRLLKAIYRPHNLYCIHPDQRQSKAFIDFFRNFSSCLDNVFVASRLVKIYYAHSSILEAQLHCMEDLFTYNRSRWHYAINLVGTELPLATNRDIVKTLKQRKGVSVVQSNNITEQMMNERFKVAYIINSQGKFARTRQSLGPAPHKIHIYKGSTHVALSRTFMEFLLTNKKAIDFRKYMQKVRNAEESFYASLYRFPEAASKGGNPVTPLKAPNVTIEMAIFVGHMTREKARQLCSVSAKHDFCIISSADLYHVEELIQTNQFFFMNKYLMGNDPVVAECTEKRLISLNMQEFDKDYSN